MHDRRTPAAGHQTAGVFVSIGGFDTHDNQMGTHPGILGQVGSALAAFYRATETLGIASQVTAFTASDFGRTLVSNNDGSDHGWVPRTLCWVARCRVAVLGARPCPPTTAPDDVGQGRLLPALAVEQYAGTLARWFGVPASDLPWCCRAWGRFSEQDLGFMAA